MPTCTYNPKFKHVKREDLEIGKTYVCGDEEHEASICWKKNGEVVPFKLTDENVYEEYERKTLNNEDSDGYYRCSCDDFDHLYLYEETPMNTHPLSTLKIGDYIKSESGYYRRVLSDVMHPEQGELAVVILSYSSKDKNSTYNKRANDVMTLFQIAELGYSLDTTPTREEILAKLTPEERDIIEGK